MSSEQVANRLEASALRWAGLVGAMLLAAGLTMWWLEIEHVLEVFDAETKRERRGAPKLIFQLVWAAPLVFTSLMAILWSWWGRPSARAWTLSAAGFAILTLGRLAVPAMDLIQEMAAKLYREEWAIREAWLFWWEPRFPNWVLVLPALAAALVWPVARAGTALSWALRLGVAMGMVWLFWWMSDYPATSDEPAELGLTIAVVTLLLASLVGAAWKPGPERVVVGQAFNRLVFPFVVFWLIDLIYACWAAKDGFTEEAFL